MIHLQLGQRGERVRHEMQMVVTQLFEDKTGKTTSVYGRAPKTWCFGSGYGPHLQLGQRGECVRHRVELIICEGGGTPQLVYVCCEN